MINKYSYKSKGDQFLSAHFQVKEFASFGNGKLYTDEVFIDTTLIDYLERIFSKVNASKAIISSGYRNAVCDKVVGGSGVGQHVNGRAADICYYDKDGSIIPSSIIVCVAHDLGMPGIAKIDNNYSHLDTRESGTYRGDETRGYSSYWTNPYEYFNISQEYISKYTGESLSQQKTVDELAQEVLQGKYGNGEDRRNSLGSRYDEVQARVNELLNNNNVNYLSNSNYSGSSIVDALNAIGVDSSYSYRSKLASANDISNYCGSAEQNTQLLNLLKQGKLKSL